MTTWLILLPIIAELGAVTWVLAWRADKPSPKPPPTATGHIDPYTFRWVAAGDPTDPGDAYVLWRAYRDRIDNREDQP